MIVLYTFSSIFNAVIANTWLDNRKEKGTKAGHFLVWDINCYFHDLLLSEF